VILKMALFSFALLNASQPSRTASLSTAVAGFTVNSRRRCPLNSRRNQTVKTTARNMKFTSTLIARAAAIWRKIEPNRNDIAVKGLKFLKRVLK